MPFPARLLLRAGSGRKTAFTTRTARSIFSTWVRYKRYGGLLRRGFARYSDLPAMLGFLPSKVRKELQSQPGCIVLAALGLGEIVNCIPLLHRLRALSPLPIVVLSRNPVQVQKVADAEGLRVLALPYPFGICQALTIDYIQTLRPVLILGMETLEELRPAFLHAAKKLCRTHILLLNHTFPYPAASHWRCTETQWELEESIPLIDAAGVTTPEAWSNLVRHGVPPARVEALPNIKFDVARDTAARTRPDRERSWLKIGPAERVVIFGSLYPEEFALVGKTCRGLLARPGLGKTRFVVAPRYIYTTPQLLQSLADAGLATIRASDKNPAGPDTNPLIVLDTTGDLPRLYAIAEVAVVAGSFSPSLYGHNPIEPAAHGVAVITGPFASSAQESVSGFKARQAILQLNHPEELETAIASLLETPETRQNMGKNARQIVAESRGAEDRYLGLVQAANLFDAVREPTCDVV